MTTLCRRPSPSRINCTSAPANPCHSRVLVVNRAVLNPSLIMALEMEPRRLGYFQPIDTDASAIQPFSPAGGAARGQPRPIGRQPVLSPVGSVATRFIFGQAISTIRIGDPCED